MVIAELLRGTQVTASVLCVSTEDGNGLKILSVATLGQLQHGGCRRMSSIEQVISWKVVENKAAFGAVLCELLESVIAKLAPDSL